MVQSLCQGFSEFSMDLFATFEATSECGLPFFTGTRGRESGWET